MVYKGVKTKLQNCHKDLVTAVGTKRSEGVQLGLRAARSLLYRELQRLKPFNKQAEAQ
jgi:hypothetical protein